MWKGLCLLTERLVFRASAKHPEALLQDDASGYMTIPQTPSTTTSSSFLISRHLFIIRLRRPLLDRNAGFDSRESTLILI